VRAGRPRFPRGAGGAGAAGHRYCGGPSGSGSGPRRTGGRDRLPRRLRIDTPLDGTVRAAGTLDLAWAARLGGLRVRAAGRGAPETELRGRLLHQGALFGVLLTLYDLGLPLLAVACRVAPGAEAAGDRF
jgi:hypothetical protein